MEILSFGVQAPGLDPGVGEMFRFVGPTPGNRAVLFELPSPTPRYLKSFPWPVIRPGGTGSGPSQSADTFYGGFLMIFFPTIGLASWSCEVLAFDAVRETILHLYRNKQMLAHMRCRRLKQVTDICRNQSQEHKDKRRNPKHELVCTML